MLSILPLTLSYHTSAPLQLRAVAARSSTPIAFLEPSTLLPAAAPFVAPLENAVSGALGETALAEFSGPVSSAVSIVVAYVLFSTVGKVVIQLALDAVIKATQGIGSVSDSKYEKGKVIGRGSYGEVYESDGVVIKATNSRDPRGDEFSEAELFMNRKLSLLGQSGCMAKFEGHYFDDDGSRCLVFKREGTLTLDRALQGNFPWNVEGALLGRESDTKDADAAAKVIRRISGQVFSNLAGIHGWSVVHRDVKGANLILAEDAKRFKLLDFGAACDLFSRTNYDPQLQVFDPKYGPPECTVTNAQRGEGGLVLSAGGRFDVFSAGLLVVQMCFKAYRTENGIVGFKKSLDAVDYDLDAWRAAAENRKENAEGFAILDKYGGFQLLKGCLKRDPSQRISSAAAASSGFCRA